MMKWLTIVLVTLILTLSTSIQANVETTNQEIIWVSDTLSSRTDDSYDKEMDVDGGTTGLIFPLLSSHYNIQEIQGNFNRGISLLKSKENICTGNKLITKERKKISHISKLPQVVFPGLRLFVNEKSKFYPQIQALKNHDDTVSITKILNNISNINFGVAGGRKYGKGIDSIIADSKWQSRFSHRTASDMAEGVIKMFERGRLDLIIEYPNVISFYQTQEGRLLKLKSFSISESLPYMLGHIMCSKSELGLKLINEFNYIVEKVSKDKRYFDTHIKWFDASTKNDAIKFYNIVYKTDFH